VCLPASNIGKHKQSSENIERIKNLWLGKKIPNGFEFTSDTNKDWLTKEKFKEIVNLVKKQIGV
jgi:hypothetical protein